MFATCVRSADECEGKYVLNDKRVCVRKETDCRSLTDEYAMEDDGKLMCVTSEECHS